MNYDGGNDMVPFGVLLKYSCHKISHELTIISELLPKYKDYNRKITITEFSYMARGLISKILAIVKWLKNYNEHYMCKEIQKFLETQEQFFRETADVLCNIARGELVVARVPMYEIDAAIHLSYGENIKLPFAIKKRFVSDKCITNIERNKVLSMINKNILNRLSLISSILPPKIESIIIKNGMVTLTVPGEFEVSLTLFNNDLSMKWTLLNIKILVEQYDIGYGTKLVHPMQLFSIHQFLQQKIVVSKNPILDLYNCLHDFCTSLQLDVLYCETSQLIGSQYRNKLIVEKYDQDAGILIISFWLLKKKQYVPSQYKIKIFKDPSKLNDGLRVIQYPLRKNMPTLDLNTGRLSICRLINETVLIYAKEKLFSLKKKLANLKPHTYIEVTGNKYPKIDFWLFEKSEHPEEECLSIHVNLFTGEFIINLPYFESKNMLYEFADMLNNGASKKELETSLRNIRMEFLVHRIKKVYSEIKLPLVSTDIVLKNIDTSPGDRKIFGRINKSDCFIGIQLVANKITDEIVFIFFIYEKRKEKMRKFFSSDDSASNNMKLDIINNPWYKIFHKKHNIEVSLEKCEKCITSNKLWAGNYRNLRDSCYVILHEWQLTEISRVYSNGLTKKNDVKLDVNNVPFLVLNSSRNISESESKNVLSYGNCFMRLDDRWPSQKWGAFTIELFIRNVALKVDFYKNCSVRESLAYKYGVKGTNIGIPCNIYWLYPNNFTQKIAEILALESCKIMNFHRLLEDIAPHYYKFFNKYCSIKYLSNCKVVFAYGQNRRYLLYLNYFGSKVDSYKFYFGQDASIGFVNDIPSTINNDPWNMKFNAHNNVHEHLLKWKLDRTHLHHLLLYLIKTCTPINILYNIYIPSVYSGVFVSEMVSRNYQMKKLSPGRLIAIDEYHIRLLFADIVIEFWIGNENNILIGDVSKECAKIPGLHSVIHTYSNKIKLYNKPFFEMTRNECNEFFEIKNKRFQVNSNTLDKLCLKIESGNKYGILIEYLHSQHILNHIKMLTKVYSLEKAECPSILKFFNICLTNGSISFNVQYLLLDLETREYNNISTIIYIDTNYFTLRILLNIDTGFQQPESFIKSCQTYFEKIIYYNYNNLSFFGFFKLLLTPSQDVLNVIENIFRFESENTILHNNTTISIQWVRESLTSENNSYILRSFVESNFEESYVVIPIKISNIIVKEQCVPLDIYVFHLKYYYNTGLMEVTDEEEVYPNLNSYLLTYSKEARTSSVNPFLLCLEKIITDYIPVLKS